MQFVDLEVLVLLVYYCNEIMKELEEKGFQHCQF